MNPHPFFPLPKSPFGSRHQPAALENKIILTIIAIVIHIDGAVRMKTVQMTLEEDLVARVDEVVRELHTTRSAFTREALQAAVERVNVRKQELQHQRGYRQHPVRAAEFSVWEDEQEWGDA